MNRISLLLTLIVCSALNLQAKIYEKIYLKDGSVLGGYISSQKPGESITVQTSYMVLNLSMNDATLGTPKDEEVGSLSPEWKELLAEYPQNITTAGDKKIVSLASLTFTNDTLWSSVCNQYQKHVKVMEMGSRLKVVFPINKSIVRKSSEIVSIRKMPFDNELLNGTVDELVGLNQQKYSGHISEQVPGKYISMTDNKGVYVRLDIKDLERKSVKLIDEKQNWKEQLEYLDVINTSEGTYTGYIMSQTYNQEENIITICDERGFVQNIKSSDVREVLKVVNSDYKPLKKVHVSNGKVIICDTEMVWNQMSKSESYYAIENEHTLVLKSESIGGKLSVYYNDVPADNQISLLKVREMVRKKYLGIERGEALNAQVKPESEEKIDKTMHVTYKVEKGNCYMLYNAKGNKAVIIRIE